MTALFEWLIEPLRWIHIAAGFTGLAAFWVPIVARKGSGVHRRFGRVFKYCAYLVLAAAALALTLRFASLFERGIGPGDEPAGFAFLVFLGYLTIVTFVVLRHGVTVLRHKQDLSAMNRPADRALARVAFAASVLIIAYALWYRPPNLVLLLALSPIGLISGKEILNAIRSGRPGSKAWLYEHLGAMLGAGIAFHTAFAVFGSTRLFEWSLQGWVAVVPWVLPAAIGIPATAIWTRHYRRRFGDTGA